jgi:hypothetical protein
MRDEINTRAEMLLQTVSFSPRRICVFGQFRNDVKIRNENIYMPEDRKNKRLRSMIGSVFFFG